MRYHDAYYYHDGGASTGDPTLIILLGVLLAVFLMGMNIGSSHQHKLQRRLGKVRGRINAIDPAQVSDSMLSTIEAALPEEKK